MSLRSENIAILDKTCQLQFKIEYHIVHHIVLLI